MKNQFWLTTLTAMILIFGSLGTVQAEILPPYGEGQIGLQAVILCENLTLRQAPGIDSAVRGTLHYGDSIIVQKQTNGWAEVFTSDAEGAGPAGWINADYIVVDPSWYRAEKATPVYAWNDRSAPKVALLDRDTVLPILKEEGGWLIVSLRGATGWICNTPIN